MLEQADRQLALMVALTTAGADAVEVDVHTEVKAWLLAEPLSVTDPEKAELLAALGVKS